MAAKRPEDLLFQTICFSLRFPARCLFIQEIMTPPPTPPTPEERLALLESQLAALAAEVAAMRGELDRRPAPPVYASRRPQARTARKSRLPTFTQRDVEHFMGRYGMLIIAVLAAVAAVGTFLSWAISRGYLTMPPAARVLAGVVFGAAIGFWGFKLRRTERSFGSSMLGLALVIELVCAYAAGPAFHLVPPWAAFAVTAAICWVLAVFAFREDDEPLWCVGFGGAALAPFVTSDGTGHMRALVAYVAVLLFTACYALGGRGWPVAWRVYYAVAALGIVGAAAQSTPQAVASFVAAFALPWVIMVTAVLTFVPHSRRRGVLRWFALLAVLVSVGDHSVSPVAILWIGAAFLGASALWLVILDGVSHIPQSSITARGREHLQLLDWIDVAGVTLFLVRQGSHTVKLLPLTYAIAALAFAAFAWRRPVNPLRDAAAFATVALFIATIESLGLVGAVQRVAPYLALGVGALVAHRFRPSRSWLAMGLGAIAIAAISSASALIDRSAYRFTPFGTEPSVSAAMVTIALVIIARFWHQLRTATRTAMGHRPEWTYAGRQRVLVRGVTLAPWVWAFIWVLIELAMAYSQSTSILLLVTYFAATAVGCVAAGRARRSARLRQIGLTLAVVAAVTATYGASTYFDFGARIAAYLVTSAFLLGIAYWYRRPGASGAATA